MITLTGLFLQTAGGQPVPNGSICFQLNVDGTVIADPNGFVSGAIPVVFQLDDSGNLQGTCQIYSNAELNPQNQNGLGTYYLVTVYDANGARVNSSPMWWQFQEAAGSTVDISQMVPISTVGGNVIFYPIIGGALGTVTSVAIEGDGVIYSGTPSTPITTSGTLELTPLPQQPNYVFAGPASGSSFAAPSFRALVAADISAAGSDTQIQFNQGGVLGASAGLTWDYTNSILAVAGIGNFDFSSSDGTPSVSAVSTITGPGSGIGLSAGLATPEGGTNSPANMNGIYGWLDFEGTTTSTGGVYAAIRANIGSGAGNAHLTINSGGYLASLFVDVPNFLGGTYSIPELTGLLIADQSSGGGDVAETTVALHILAQGGGAAILVDSGGGLTTLQALLCDGALTLAAATPTVASGQIGLGTSLAATATGGSATLPSNPVGFLEINIGGTMYKLPYYAA